MSYQKAKSEHYKNLGGINQKASEYITGPNDFLDLKNFDFQKVGALSSRDGSTFSIGLSFSYGASFVPARIEGLYDVQPSDGLTSAVIIPASAGAPGFSVSSTFNLFRMNDSYGVTNLNTYWGITFPGNVIDRYSITSIQDVVYGAEGNFNHFKYTLRCPIYGSGFNEVYGRFGVPYINRNFVGASLQYIIAGSGSFLGYYKYRFSLQTFSGNEAGCIGVAAPNRPTFSWPDWSYEYGFTTAIGSSVYSVSSIGFTGLNYLVGTTQLQHGVFNIVVHRAIGASGAFYRIGQTSAFNPVFTDTNPSNDGYPLSTDYVSMFNFPVKYFEQYNNYLFYSFGATTWLNYSGNPDLLSFSIQNSNQVLPQNVYWSILGQPEVMRASNFIQITNDRGESVSGLKSVGPYLLIFTPSLTQVLSGQVEDSFTLRLGTPEFGCLNNQAAVVYDDTCLFLSEKGIVKFTGANFELISYKVQPIFQRMNLTAAKRMACGVHHKLRNQVWFALPIDGAEFNNIIVVYDYLTDAWTTFDNSNPSANINVNSLAYLQGPLSQRTVWAGGYTGIVSHFGPSFTSDIGIGFTCVAKTKYHTLFGESITQQARRFYLNCNPITGLTLPITINMRPDFGSTISITRTMYQNPFQSRIDFGIPCKSVSFELIRSSPSIGISFDGYTFEGRFQRNV